MAVVKTWGGVCPLLSKLVLLSNSGYICRCSQTIASAVQTYYISCVESSSTKEDRWIHFSHSHRAFRREELTQPCRVSALPLLQSLKTFFRSSSMDSKTIPGEPYLILTSDRVLLGLRVRRDRVVEILDKYSPSSIIPDAWASHPIKRVES